MAILLVVGYHVCQQVLFEYPALNRVAHFGSHGVDLFFVLSGWLIGGLLWRELRAHGDVDVPRFIGRRAMRTVPPYLVALVLYSIAYVRVKGGELDWAYLLFLQNFQDKIPYFLISWSLCVEEHFYLIMPAAVLLINRFWRRFAVTLMVGAVALPTVFRWMEYDAGRVASFGYLSTATHLRYEGLLLGVLASFIRYNRPAIWGNVRRQAAWLAGFAGVAVVLVSMLSGRGWYAFFYLAVSLLFGSAVVALAEATPLRFARERVVYWVAISSYSVYLTHALSIRFAINIADLVGLGVGVKVLFSFGCIAVVGLAFYRLVEVPAIWLRQRLAPNRKRPSVSERSAPA